jgi:hypothetical protein
MIDGDSMSGRMSIANLDSENAPTVTMAMKTIKVVIGPLMAMSDKFIYLRLLLSYLFAPLPLPARVTDIP